MREEEECDIRFEVWDDWSLLIVLNDGTAGLAMRVERWIGFRITLLRAIWESNHGDWRLSGNPPSGRHSDLHLCRRDVQYVPCPVGFNCFTRDETGTSRSGVWNCNHIHMYSILVISAEIECLVHVYLISLNYLLLSHNRNFSSSYLRNYRRKRTEKQ